MPYFNLPFGIRISKNEPIDGDRYKVTNIDERDLLITENRAFDGLQVFDSSTKTLYILKDVINSTWGTISTDASDLTSKLNNTTDTFNGTLTINGSINLFGDIIQDGSNYVTHAEQIYTEKDFIILRDKAISPIADGSISGIEILKANGTNNVILGSDASAVLRIGWEGDTLQAIATREDHPINNGYAYWNDSSSMFKTYDLKGYVDGSLSRRDVSFGSGGQIPFMNNSSTNFSYSNNFSWNGNNLLVKSSLGDSLFIGENVGLNIITGNILNTYLGNNSGHDSTNCANNVFVGYATGYKNITGSANTFIGKAAGYSSTTGTFDVYIGYEAGYNNTYGSRNTFVGYRSGELSKGNSNIFIGYMSGGTVDSSNKLYIENSASNQPLIYGEFDNNLVRINGNLDVSDNLTVDNSVYFRGIKNASTNKVVFYNEENGELSYSDASFGGGIDISLGIGTQIPFMNNTSDNFSYSNNFKWEGPRLIINSSLGTGNIFIGTNTGRVLSDGNYNIITGYNAGYSLTSGSSNIFVGYESAYSGSSGSNNMFAGFRSGYSNRGSNNVFLGYRTGYSNGLTHYNTFLGYQAGYANTDGGENVFIGANAGNSPTLSYNTFIGGYSGFGNSASCNTFIGYYSGQNSGQSHSNIFIGYYAGSYLSNVSNKLYIANSSTNKPLIYGEFDTNTLRINGKLDVSGNLTIDNSVYFRGIKNASTNKVVYYNSNTYEISYADASFGSSMSLGIVNQIPYMNLLSTDVSYSPNFTWDGNVFTTNSYSIGQSSGTYYHSLDGTAVLDFSTNQSRILYYGDATNKNITIDTNSLQLKHTGKIFAGNYTDVNTYFGIKDSNGTTRNFSFAIANPISNTNIFTVNPDGHTYIAASLTAETSVYFAGIKEGSTNKVIFYNDQNGEISYADASFGSSNVTDASVNYLYEWNTIQDNSISSLLTAINDSSSFISLSDTPSNYLAGKLVAVNDASNGLEYVSRVWRENANVVTLDNNAANVLFYDYIELEQDGGEATLVDKNVTSSSGAGLEESYNLKLNNENMLKIYGISTGDGSLNDSKGVSITTNYFYIGDPASDAATNFCWRFYITDDVSGNLVVQKRNTSGDWVESQRFI